MRTYNSNSHPLPPEFEKAYKVACKQLDNPNAKLSIKLPSSIWTTSGGCVCIKKKPKIREIPSGDGWRWNQAKRRYNVTHDKSGSSLELLKLVPRKTVRSHLKTLPTLKLWQVTVTGKRNLAIFWCEKGSDSIESVDDDIDLADFSFLAPFMDPAEASTLWPTETPVESHPVDMSNLLPSGPELDNLLEMLLA